MQFLNFTATDHYDLLDKMVRELSGEATLNTPAFTGTGNGVLRHLRSTPAGITETWTLTATSATNFTVVGSVSGAMAAATVGTPYDNGFISFVITAGGTAFVATDNWVFTTTLGTMATGERWEVMRACGIKAISASTFLSSWEPWGVIKGDYQPAHNGWSTAIAMYANCWLSWEFDRPFDITAFTMQGSATTNKSPNTFSLQWSDDNTTWTTLQTWSGVTWTASEVKSYTISSASPGKRKYWRVYVTSNNGNTSYTEILKLTFPQIYGSGTFDFAIRASAWMKAPGQTGLDPVYINFQIYDRPTADWYNMAINVATGYADVNKIADQPGAHAPMAIPLYNNSTPVNITADGQGVVISAYVNSAIGVSAIACKINSFGVPSQWPYPVLLGAPLTTPTATRYSGTITLAYKGNRTNLKLRKPNGDWIQPLAWPYQNSATFRTVGGDHPMLPIVLYETAPNTFGTIPYIQHITGFSNAVGNTVTVGAETWAVWSGPSPAGLNDFFAQRIA